MKSKWRILARHKWVVGALITESVNDDGTLRRYTATIRGYREWRIFEGTMLPGIPELAIRIVHAIRDQIDKKGEDCEAFMATNEHSHNASELEKKAETFEHPISEALEEFLVREGM